MTTPDTLKTPEERFLEVAPYRVTKVIQAINSLSKCSSKNYKYDDNQVRKMISAIRNEIKDCEAKFKNKGKKGTKEFAF
jgi:hypothetical protein